MTVIVGVAVRRGSVAEVACHAAGVPILTRL